MNLKLWIRSCGTALLSAFVIGSALAQGGRPGVTPLNPPQLVDNDGKVEVLEFFAYGCIHCFHLEPKLVEWIAKQPADVKVKRVPGTYAVRGIDSIPIFYTLEAMGVEEKLHQKIFDAANVDNVMLGNPATLNKWLEAQGVDPRKYEEVLRSFSVQNRINRARKMTGDYKVQGTPMFVVDGRYVVEQVGTGDPGADRMFTTIDQLIAQTRESNKAAAPVPPPSKKQ